MKNFLIFFVITLLSFNLIAQKKAPKTSKKSYINATDIAQNYPKPYPVEQLKQYKSIEIHTKYLTMRDGTKIAIDIYLPENLEEGTKLPCLVRQTRYWRSPKINFPFSLFTNGLIGRAGKMINTCVEHGYAIVNVDARGSGASFGSRAHPWTEDEVKDGYEIIDWIIEQPWSDGNIGSLGVSYGGTTAEFLTTTKHPNLKAVALMFSLFDIYEDNAFPGGIHNQWFTENWGKANDLMDKDELPIKKSILNLLVGGVSRVKGEESQLNLEKALQEHRRNLNVHNGAVGVDFRDDATKEQKGISIESVDIFSPHSYLDALNESGVAIYSYSGWMDGAYQNAAIKRHINSTNPNNKLIIGPWEHGGAFNISPENPSKAGFSHIAELLKFFDYHLRDIQNGIDKEAKVHYFTLVEDQWKTSENWPPNKTYTDLYFGLDNQLNEKQDKRNEFEKSINNLNFKSGEQTRWKAVNGKVTTAHVYYDWDERVQALSYFETDELEQDWEISGHPQIELYLNSNEKDAAIFVYLQEVDKNGKAKYITEGQLRLSHRKVNEEGIYKEIGPAISHKRADAQSSKGTNKIQFDLIPCSYLVKKGNKIRVSFSTNDMSHFEKVGSENLDLKLLSGEKYPSKISIPSN